MSDQPVRGLLEILQQIPDPRGREGLRHPMSAMLAAIICATLCGFRGLRATGRWPEIHGVVMWHLLGFRRKPPVRQTYAELLKQIDVEALERTLLEFSERCVPESERAAMADLVVEVWDGKTLRGTRNGEQRAEAILVRMQALLGQILASVRIPLDTNESKAAFEMAKSLVLTGTLVVGDAAYCQRDTCQQIVDSGGDYLVTVKGNQPQLLRDIELAFAIPEGFSPLCS